MRGFLVLAVLMFALSGPSGAQAQSLPASCGAEEHELLKQTAWQHAQREVEMAQRIILKPDSVLEYTCFQDELNRPGISGVGSLAVTPVNQYLFGSYGATFGGGTYEHDADDGGRAPASANCDAMNRVWSFLKCQNFGSGEGADDFFLTFEELAIFDPRQEPLACESSDAMRSDKWRAANSQTDFTKPLTE